MALEDKEERLRGVSLIYTFGRGIRTVYSEVAVCVLEVVFRTGAD